MQSEAHRACSQEDRGKKNTDSKRLCLPSLLNTAKNRNRKLSWGWEQGPRANSVKPNTRRTCLFNCRTWASWQQSGAECMPSHGSVKALKQNSCIKLTPDSRASASSGENLLQALIAFTYTHSGFIVAYFSFVL